MTPRAASWTHPGEALAGMRRPGNAGSNTTADHVTVLDDALAQIPDALRHGTPILIRSDFAGCTRGFLAHIRSVREHGVDARFSVGVAITEDVRQAFLRATGRIPGQAHHCQQALKSLS
jgi:hypothetical protein